VQIQRHLHVGSQRTEKDTSQPDPIKPVGNDKPEPEPQGGEARDEWIKQSWDNPEPGPMDPARLIGSTTGITDVQAEAVSEMLEPCNEVHWDGDSVSEGAFSSALGVGKHPFIAKDMTDQYEEGKLANPDRKAVAHCSTPNKGYCPKEGNPFQVMSPNAIHTGAIVITNAMGGDSWKDVLDKPQPELEFKGNAAQYLELAAADIIAAPPKEIFWLYDDDRKEETYKLWISLAEWYAYCDKYLYKIVNHAGEQIVPDTSKKPFSVTAMEMGWGTNDQKCQPKA
jgi:hypothetical protein